MSYTIIDIETGTLPLADLTPYLDELEYTGVAKDPVKVATALAEKRQEFIDRAALSAETGLILAIGMKGGFVTMLENDTADAAGEKAMLAAFLVDLRKITKDEHLIIGHNIKSFDFPFIARRCWRHGLIGSTGWQPGLTHHGRYWRDQYVDTMEAWKLGQSDYQYKNGETSNRLHSSLNRLARYFGLPSKAGTGDQFSTWWNGGERDKAREYLTRDLELCEQVAKRMGIIGERVGSTDKAY